MDVKGYEGQYLISDHGRVLSVYRKKHRQNGVDYYQKTRMMRPAKTTTGYYKVDLKKDGGRESAKIHRLVAEHFVANPYEEKTVNHIDGDPLNNHYLNLEWVSQRENVIHAIETGLKESFYINKASLEHLYLEKNMTPKQIGELFDISDVPVRRLIEEYGIKKETTTKYRVEEEWLVEQLGKGRSNADIAREIGCDASLISVYKNRIERGENMYA